MRTYYKAGKKATDRVMIVGIFLTVFACTIIIRLFYLQISQFKYYRALADNQQQSTTIEPATRGTIFMKAGIEDTFTKVAINSMLDLIYIDPNPYNSKDLDPMVDTEFVGTTLAPLFYSHYCDNKNFKNNSKKSCEEAISELTGSPITKQETVTPTKKKTTTKTKTTESGAALPQNTREVEKTQEDFEKDIAAFITGKMKEPEVNFVPLMYSKEQTTLDELVKAFPLPGIYAGQGLIYANPIEIRRSDGVKMDSSYIPLGEKLGLTDVKFQGMLTRRLSRYVKITDRVDPELSDKILSFNAQEQKCPIFYAKPEKQKDLLPMNDPLCQHIRISSKGKPVRNFYGIGRRRENWRYYPEESLASPLIGFVNNEKTGVYGIEEEFDSLLRGTDGEFKLKSDPMGRFIATDIKADELKSKENGVDIYMTIDRVLQKKVEELLEAKVKSTSANSGQAIIMDPYTGDLLAMAQYPNFNPNNFSEVYEMQPTNGDPGKGIPLFIKDETGKLILVDDYGKGKIPSGTEKFMYVNKVGPAAYFDRPVQGTYEPGSIFKPIIMASALDAGEVTPQTRYMDRGELKVDEFTIHNVSKNCLGFQNMINVLNNSCNVGMSFIAKKLGRALTYRYVTDFGFGNRTDIELPNEAKGLVVDSKSWSDAKLFNAAFGQGLTVTPLQMAQAYSALANGGILLSPRIVEKIVHSNGKEEKRKVQSQYAKRVISKETADTIAAMLTSVVENGGSKIVKMDHFFVAGKTGTAQIAGRGGYEPDEIGNTNGSFAGFFPADKPRFVVITMIERPRSSKWADQTAAPLFKEIIEFVVDYYHIPPEK